MLLVSLVFPPSSLCLPWHNISPITVILHDYSALGLFSGEKMLTLVLSPHKSRFHGSALLRSLARSMQGSALEKPSIASAFYVTLIISETFDQQCPPLNLVQSSFTTSFAAVNGGNGVDDHSRLTLISFTVSHNQPQFTGCWERKKTLCMFPSQIRWPMAAEACNTQTCGLRHRSLWRVTTMKSVAVLEHFDYRYVNTVCLTP